MWACKSSGSGHGHNAIGDGNSTTFSTPYVNCCMHLHSIKDALPDVPCARALPAECACGSAGILGLT